MQARRFVLPINRHGERQIMPIRTLGIVVPLLALATSAQAQVLTIPAGTTGLSPLQGKITDVRQVRVPRGNAATGAETRVTLEFALNGCLDSLLPLVTHQQIQGRRATVYVTAFNAHNQQSTVARCVAMPKARAEVSLPGVFQRNQINVVFLEQGTPDDRAASAGRSTP